MMRLCHKRLRMRTSQRYALHLSFSFFNATVYLSVLLLMTCGVGGYHVQILPPVTVNNEHAARVCPLWPLSWSVLCVFQAQVCFCVYLKVFHHLHTFLALLPPFPKQRCDGVCARACVPISTFLFRCFLSSSHIFTFHCCCFPPLCVRPIFLASCAQVTHHMHHAGNSLSSNRQAGQHCLGRS